MPAEKKTVKNTCKKEKMTQWSVYLIDLKELATYMYIPHEGKCLIARKRGFV